MGFPLGKVGAHCESGLKIGAQVGFVREENGDAGIVVDVECDGLDDLTFDFGKVEQDGSAGSNVEMP